MDRTETEEQSEEQVSKDDLSSKDNLSSKEDLSEFHLRSLDIDIAFYGTKLKKLKKTES